MSILAAALVACADAPDRVEADPCGGGGPVPVVVHNFSFETPAVGQATGWTANGGASSGGVDPFTNGFTAAADGVQFHYLNLPGFGGPDPSVTQSDPALIGPAEAGTYVLTVAGGRRNNDATTDGTYVIELLAGPWVIGSQTVVDPFNSYAPDTWNDIVAIATLPGNDFRLGLDLSIRLSATEGTGGIRSQGQFDNVRLTHTPAISFSDMGAGLAGASQGGSEFGDYDGDGDLDLVVTGRDFLGTPIARIYRNDAGSFVDPSALPAGAATAEGAVAWGDYDGDGDLDLALCGNTDSDRITRIYQNTGGNFADIGAGLLGVDDSDLDWGDYDNDGDLDLVVTGDTGAAASTILYRNDAGAFVDVMAGFTPVRFSGVEWGDYDNDGDLDVVIAGNQPSVATITTIYENVGGTFTPDGNDLPGAFGGTVAWGDYDGDGDLDLLIIGGFAKLFNNVAGVLTEVGAGLNPMDSGTLAWGDLDNDGDLDLVMVGFSGSASLAIAYENQSGTFNDMGAGLPELFGVSIALGDTDNDGDLDVLIAGEDFGSKLTRIYEVTGVPANCVPTAPTGLLATSDGTTVTFQWNPAIDTGAAPLHTQGAHPPLTYNLRIGTSPGGAEIKSPMADASTGYRRVAKRGNVGNRLQWTMPLSALGGGTVSWSVQAVDPGYLGSPFAADQFGTVSVDAPPSSGLQLRSTGANPFRSEARLAYSLTRPSRVELTIFDLAGRRVNRLVADERSAGRHEVRWAGVGDNGQRVRPGLYLARLRAGGERTAVRLLRLE